MPGGPTNLFNGLGFYAGRRRDWNPLVWGIAGAAAPGAANKHAGERD